MPRLRPLADPVTLFLDGRPIEAERGEPAVFALVAAGHMALARSPKFHRPRGPYCLRAGCDGCLARVDGVPNVMTCRTPSVDAMRIETQNVLGSRQADLLRMADWFFPEGMNPHELMAGVPGAERVLEGLARRMSGLGRLPEGARALVRPAARRRDVDVLIVGAGPSGMAASVELAARGKQVEVVDDDLAWGGCLRPLGAQSPEVRPSAGDWGDWEALRQRFAAQKASGNIVVRARTTAVGIYGDDVLVFSEEPLTGEGCAVDEAARSGPGPEGSASGGLDVITAKTLVLAPGAHDGAVAFEGNDLPGVMSARAACRLLADGVVPGARVAIVEHEGGTLFGVAYARAQPSAERLRGLVVRATGATRVRHVRVRTAEGEKRVPCDTLLVDAPGAPAFELCMQAGAQVERSSAGYVVKASSGGLIREGVFAVGEVVGTPLRPDSILAEARVLADRAG